MGSKTLTRVDYIKYLGVLVDSTLSWKPHITELSKKLPRTTCIFFKIRHYVSRETLKLLYYSLFYSFISYAIVVWGLTHPSVLDCLYKLQKKVVRAISFKDRYAHSTPPFHKLKILKIHEVHCLKLPCLVYECTINESVRPLSDFFVPLYSIHNHNTRQASKGNIFLPHIFTTHYGKRSAKYAGAILWNDLQPMIKESCSTNAFIKKLHDYYLSFYD